MQVVEDEVNRIMDQVMDLLQVVVAKDIMLEGGYLLVSNVVN